MKKVFVSLFLVLLIVLSSNVVKAMTYEEALNDSKLMSVLIYADWADNMGPVNQVFNEMSQNYSDKYNFVRLNIASSDAKLFNKRYHIYPNLPYVLLFKEGGKVSRYLQNSCVTDSACFSEKLKMFAN